MLPEAITESLPSFLNGSFFLFFFFYNVATRKRGKKQTRSEQGEICEIKRGLSQLFVSISFLSSLS